ncbi:glycosyltransferase family 4 protein [Paenisporosarcina sp. OV554]|uniref:glycosyltransferase family 4 protein n=1 Tax=Paenisporosarcina sp. OV554 TaxID=2135694 RepID=UPI000D3485CE|nr:MraY family glycosyltransferase [Paenisporosarcina sp. OV554]PUB10203.1 UDP-GlcNAc:undecaprenyl-phosphate GlcNAc-1-phosphate transferase [Paenisporosarcina sp. OV554]
MFLATTLILVFIASLLITPLVKKFAIKIGAVDQPNHRKVHVRIMPRLGGLAIFLAFIIGFFIYQPESPSAMYIIIGAFIIVLTGVFDDLYELRPIIKLAGQLLAAGIVVYLGNIEIGFINLPFGGELDFGFLSAFLTIIWIVGITNAVNLIDGLDGLAAGVSTIGLLTLSIMAFLMGDMFVLAMSLMLAVSTIGFLFYNFYPAKIFMGDTGALFLGFIIGVLSLLGFKNITFISLAIPIIILGVPISDTFFAIIRRLRTKQKLSAPDKSHLHHCLLNSGFSHRQTVLLIYGMAAMFGGAGILFSQSTVWGGILIISLMFVAIEIVVELIGLAGKNYRPLLNFVKYKGN